MVCSGLLAHDARANHVGEAVVREGSVEALADVTTEAQGGVKSSLSVEFQLAAHRKVLNALEAIPLHGFANRSLEQEAGCVEPALAVAVVQLEQLVECRLSNLPIKSKESRGNLPC